MAAFQKERSKKPGLAMQETERAIQQVSEQVEEIKELVLDIAKKLDVPPQDKWIDGQEVMLALRIGSRTLRTLRETEKLSFSRLHHKLYYRESDVKTLLASNYIRYHLNHT